MKTSRHQPPSLKFFRNSRDARWNSSAIAYVLLTYSCGWLLLLTSSLATATGILAFFSGTMFVAHSMIIAAYLIHECAHRSLLRTPSQNEWLGKCLGWITGSCYGTFSALRIKHVRHHGDNADLLSFDLQAFLARHPKLTRLISCLEYFHIPAVEILMHVMLMLGPWLFPDMEAQRTRALRLIVVRGGLLFAAGCIAPLAVVGYGLAQLILMQVLRFMDAFQHNYDSLLNLQDKTYVAPHRGDADYELQHTFSNLISRRFPWLNLLVLNFCYHNAHHIRPMMPWYQLPEYHSQQLGADCQQVIPLSEQLRSYHKFRLLRLQGINEEGIDFRRQMKNGLAVGVVGVSFLTAF